MAVISSVLACQCINTHTHTGRRGRGRGNPAAGSVSCYCPICNVLHVAMLCMHTSCNGYRHSLSYSLHYSFSVSPGPLFFSLSPSLCYNSYFPFSDFDAYLLHADMDIALDSACRLSDYQCKNQVSQHILLLV